jgi:hypothetical protein
MQTEDTQASDDDLRIVYDAIVDYHNNLVHMRFTVAALYLAASGFLAGALFSGTGWAGPKAAVPALGLALSLIAWLREIRTYCLLENLAERGGQIEKQLQLGGVGGFFDLMAHQPIPPRLPFVRKRLPAWRAVRYVVSHSLGLDLLYTSLTIFWLTILLLSK